ncbi:MULTISPECIES: universal stress protein [Mesorhizobium]|uniref:Universal stress protein n=1 Tax=Mesorhizobium denitrificans TaxID=2294114 RepID=A0A371X669_9HYPH|nr:MULTISPECIES: universal stress protein [Mesorhizobium]RFC64693.1 universal stress protein [Mesorhizobium denitrificans]
MYTHLLIAVDGSELAEKGARHGLALAKPLGAKVTVLTVTEPLGALAMEAAIAGGVRDPLVSYDLQMDEHVHRIDQTISAHAEELGVEIELARETDESPAEAIVRAAQLKECDLIVMASHGRRGLNRLLLGSQTTKVLASTTIPVLVVR